MLERASIVGQLVKNLPAMQETQVRFLGWEDPWRRKWQPTPVFLPGESHGRRSLVEGDEMDFPVAQMAKNLPAIWET